MIELGIVNADWPLSPRDPEIPPWSQAPDRELNELKMAVYAAQIDRMDQGIGRILAKVRELGVADNTLVMFLSDNGGDGFEETPTLGIPPGTQESSYIYGRPWANVSNTPLRGYKRGMHEGGISTPLVACWPNVVAAGAINHLAASNPETVRELITFYDAWAERVGVVPWQQLRNR
ncbi:MAG: sulfatase-like hydrolase/transferase [Planctomycetes bacterium]|nr:sulfatase-like hydrolase/transferase [Planctomycetota bacterium]